MKPLQPLEPLEPLEPQEHFNTGRTVTTTTHTHPGPTNPNGTVTVTTTAFPQTARQPTNLTGLSQMTPQNSLQSGIVLGVDSLVPSGATLLTNAQSNAFLGQAPQYWGRYFYAPDQINAQGKKDSHYSPDESALLRAQNIRVLPIARQTAHVANGNKAVNDANQNVAAIFQVFPAEYLSGADPDVLIFLDVEQHTSMTADYYEQWSATIISEGNRISKGRVTLHPAVYASQSDDHTWNALKQAMNNGATCDGVWIARYLYHDYVPEPWSDAKTTPRVAIMCPILAWQYWASPDGAPAAYNFDTNIANPAHADMLMSRLVMPPALAVGV